MTTGYDSPAAPTACGQLSFDELGEPLHAITFTVVDLETTGGAANNGDAITEIGAVKVCGGAVLGEFQTLVDPLVSISPFVSVLTGITDAMVSGAPSAAVAVPSFLEFARGSVLVAHNAPFDIGFLKAACVGLALPWPGFAVVDTAVLARRVLTRDEVPNCKLATLAPFFRAGTTPNHRALDDARATVDVLHGLIGRLGSLGAALASRTPGVHQPGVRRATAQASSGRRDAIGSGRLHLPRRPGSSPLRGDKSQPQVESEAIFRGERDAQPDGRDGRPGRAR